LETAFVSRYTNETQTKSLASFSLESFLAGLHNKPVLNSMRFFGMDIVGALVREPGNINQLAGEISQLIQSCHAPESMLSLGKRQANGQMMKSVLAINNALDERWRQ
jgi:hypothetical protein